MAAMYVAVEGVHRLGPYRKHRGGETPDSVRSLRRGTFDTGR